MKIATQWTVNCRQSSCLNRQIGRHILRKKWMALTCPRHSKWWHRMQNVSIGVPRGKIINQKDYILKIWTWMNRNFSEKTPLKLSHEAEIAKLGYSKWKISNKRLWKLSRAARIWHIRPEIVLNKDESTSLQLMSALSWFVFQPGVDSTFFEPNLLITAQIGFQNKHPKSASLAFHKMLF